jgi:hypothetical protein
MVNLAAVVGIYTVMHLYNNLLKMKDSEKEFHSSKN